MREAAGQHITIPERSRLSCLILGHRAANKKSCECLVRSLTDDGRITHVRHILTCFLGGHTYERLTDRSGHHEYICRSCGHQLLVSATADSFETRDSFLKHPRYLCSLFGHKVYPMGERHGLTEYVCPCGHSFMKSRKGLKKITHPLTCTLLGHFVRFLTDRLNYSEYVCSVCGHTFCYTAKRPS
jgi:DNA-directed RNA polymerase subunit RPC12/RpoP